MHNHPYGFIREGKIYLKSYLNFPEREIGEVKDSEESTFKYFEERYKVAEKKVFDLEAAIEASENKGSYLMKLIHLKQSLVNYDGLGDYIPLLKKLDYLEQELNEIIAQNREKNLEIKKALVEEAKQLKNITDFPAGTEKFNELKDKWIKTGSVGKEHEEDLENLFNDYKNDFFSRRRSFYEDKKLLIQSRVEKYEEIISEVKRSAEDGDLGATVKLVKKLQEKWKKIGEIPPKQNKELWQKLKRVTDPVFEQYTNLRKTRPKSDDLVGNLKQKKILIEKAKEFYIKETPYVIDKIKTLQNEWKILGDVPKEYKNKINEEFLLACDKAREISFVLKLASTKHKSFHHKPIKDKLRIKISLIRELLYRDEKDLELYKENISKFTSDTNSANNMVNNKLQLQIRKVKVKKQILHALQEQLHTSPLVKE